MTPDLEKYRPYVADLGLTEAQEAELLETVWAIMESFVDQAFARAAEERDRTIDEQKDASSTNNVLISSSSRMDADFAAAAIPAVRKESFDDRQE